MEHKGGTGTERRKIGSATDRRMNVRRKTRGMERKKTADGWWIGRGWIGGGRG